MNMTVNDGTDLSAVRYVALAVRNSDGDFQIASSDDGFMLSVDYRTTIGMNKVPGHSKLRTFGQRTGLSTAATGDDVWEGTATTIPIPATAGEQMTIVSTSVNDTAGGTGVQSVDVMYLDASGNVQVEVRALDGTNPVNTVATNIRFINAFHSETTGTGGVAAGTISIYRTGDATRVYSVLTPRGNRALTCTMMVPVGKTFYCNSFCTSGASGKPLSVRFRATCTEESVLTDFFLYKDVVFIQDSSHVHDFSIPLVFPALTIIKVTIFSSQAGGASSAAMAGWYE